MLKRLNKPKSTMKRGKSRKKLKQRKNLRMLANKLKSASNASKRGRRMKPSSAKGKKLTSKNRLSVITSSRRSNSYRKKAALPIWLTLSKPPELTARSLRPTSPNPRLRSRSLPRMTITLKTKPTSKVTAV
jgi:hypothetical protein